MEPGHEVQPAAQDFRESGKLEMAGQSAEIIAVGFFGGMPGAAGQQGGAPPGPMQLPGPPPSMSGIPG